MFETEEEKSWTLLTKWGCNLWIDGARRTRKGYYPNLMETCYYNEKGEFHRMAGPAMIFHDTKGNVVEQLWFYCGNRIKCSSQKEFESLMRLKAFW